MAPLGAARQRRKRLAVYALCGVLGALGYATTQALRGGGARDDVFGGGHGGEFTKRETHFKHVGDRWDEKGRHRESGFGDADDRKGATTRRYERETRMHHGLGAETARPLQHTPRSISGGSSNARRDGFEVSSGVANDGDESGNEVNVNDDAGIREPAEDTCHVVENADVWAELTDGVANGLNNQKETSSLCCQACKDLGADKCNLWTWSPTTRACFLKKGDTAYQPLDRRPGIVMTAGAVWPEQPRYVGASVGASSTDAKHPPTCLHTMITSNGQPYMNWQTRVFFQTWLRASGEPGSPLKHFTRVLHRTKNDELMNEVPTIRITPTHKECDEGCDYAVKDRARAIAEWSQLADSKKCSHVLMAEADYLLVRSPPRSVLLAKGHTYGFLFGYIIPWHKDAAPASEKLAEATWGADPKDWPDLKRVPQSGNAPQVVHSDDLSKVATVWADLVEFGETDVTVKNVFGWVRDMYAFDFAAAKVGLTVHYPPVPLNKLMVQPPADTDLGKGCLMHYTWSPILSDSKKNELWRFDKRSFRGGEGSTSYFTVLGEQPLPPAWDPDAGYKLQAGEVVTQNGLELMALMATTFNTGVRALQKFPMGCHGLEDVRLAREG